MSIASWLVLNRHMHTHTCALNMSGKNRSCQLALAYMAQRCFLPSRKRRPDFSVSPKYRHRPVLMESRIIQKWDWKTWRKLPSIEIKKKQFTGFSTFWDSLPAFVAKAYHLLASTCFLEIPHVSAKDQNDDLHFQVENFHDKRAEHNPRATMLQFCRYELCMLSTLRDKPSLPNCVADF